MGQLGTPKRLFKGSSNGLQNWSPNGLLKRAGLAGLLLAALLTMPLLSALARQEGQLAPPEIPGELVYVPFPVAITLDGQLSDWTGVPQQTVTKGSPPSSNPAENGSLTFSVAADQSNFYITMRMADQNIVAGKHDTSFWNEDSFEFYLNLSGVLGATAYTPQIHQVNINATDIGNSDPEALTITGINSAPLNVRGFVFKTDDGWGFEAAVPLAGLAPEHGLTVGFQAQINGASKLDRDVKLIWSNADKADNSWQNPSLFGQAMFVEVGQQSIPTPAPTLPPPTATPQPTWPKLALNQTGYYPTSKKRATLASSKQEPLEWTLKDSGGAALLSGQTLVKGLDAASGDSVHLIDFSAYTTPGTGYRLVADGVESLPFDIAPNLYAQLKADALSYFYHNRSGIPIEAQYAGGEQWARPAGHQSDNKVTCYKGKDLSGKEWPGCDYSLNVFGGWYDAGDFGKYVVNGGISVWTLMNIYEHSPAAFGDGTLSIPENKNGVPDILDEARWQMRFLLGMQIPPGQPHAGMAHHKMHDRRWGGLPMLPPTTVDNNDGDNGRYLYPPSTAATLNLAATAAQCARIWKSIEPAFASQCLSAAETAWTAARTNPDLLFGSVPGEGGGDYGDSNVEDEFYWAAAELYITTGNTLYHDFLAASPFYGTIPAGVSAMGWPETTALGTISLALVPNGLPEAELQKMRQAIITVADSYLETLNKEGYLVPIPNEYWWGSNSAVANNMIIMGLAYTFSGERRYLDGVTESMDYLLGRNPLNKSYVSGYGENPLQHPHHRFWANEPENGYPPPPPGVLSGGPNSNPDDPAGRAAKILDQPSGKSYIDDRGSWTTNEVTINWNAPFAWGATFIDEQMARPAPVSPEGTAAPAPAVTPAGPGAEESPSDTPDATATTAAWPYAAGLLGLVILAGLGWWLWRQRQGSGQQG